MSDPIPIPAFWFSAEMSSGLCKDPKATYKLTAQNGATYNTTAKVAAKCPKGKKGSKKRPLRR